jgi:hypothetical protein
MRAIRVGVALIVLSMLPRLGEPQVVAAAARGGVGEAKTLYAAASYDDALVALAGLDTAEAHEYRALCLLALARPREAEQAAEAMIEADPRYAVAADERPPRFVKLVADTRRRVMPALIRTRFAAAREQYQANNLAASREQFAVVLALADAPDVTDLPELADLRLLAKAFSDLMSAVESAVPSNAPAATADGGRRPLPLPTVTQPEPVRQQLPPAPATIRALGRVFTGALKLEIGADGRVKTAAIERSVHQLYDPVLLTAAHQWLYKPATVNGKPVESERVVQVRLDR